MLLVIETLCCTAPITVSDANSSSNCLDELARNSIGKEMECEMVTGFSFRRSWLPQGRGN